MMDNIVDSLFLLQDLGYRQLQQTILPTLPPDRIIGVRTPELRKLANKIHPNTQFLLALPHQYFEEDQIHCFILSKNKDFQSVIQQLDLFLPYINNWATCDQMNPKVFRKHREELLPFIDKWLHAYNPYTVRFGIKMLMDHFLDSDFSPIYPEIVASVKREEYYVRMMIAWYFATALAKQYDEIFPFLAQTRLEKWTHNKAIQKAIESFRISDEHKQQLRSLRIK